MRKIKIVIPGKYIGIDGKAKRCGTDYVLETSDWYADSLLVDGFAREYTPRQVSSKKNNTIVADNPIEKKQDKRRTAVTEKRNPFSEK